MPNITGYRFAGDIEIRSMLFVTSDRQVIDVSSLIKEINIYQDINEHYVQCDVVFNDAIRLIHTISNGFTGSEMLIVSFRNRTEKDDIEFNDYVFGLYELSDRQQLDQDEVYVMSGISIEAYSSTVQKISRAMGRTRATQISRMIENLSHEFLINDAAKSIYRELGDTLSFNIDKTIDIESTNNAAQLIIADLSVDAAIDFLVNEADSDDHIPLYTFYEDKDGYKLRNISTLVEQDTVETYTRFPFNYDSHNDHVSNEREYDFTRIMSYAVLRQTNLLENAQKGLFKATVNTVDIHNKKYSSKTFDYTKENQNFKKLNDVAILGEVITNDHIDYTLTSRENTSFYSADNHTKKAIDEFIARRNSYKQHIFNTVLEITVAGNSELTVGQTLNLQFPIINDIEDTQEQLDKYLSGKYLITKLRHKLTGKDDQAMLTILEVTKDNTYED